MLKQDYLLRQVESLAMTLAKLFFNTDVVTYELDETKSYSDTDILYNKLNKLIFEGKINEAENLLFDELDTSNIEYLRVGIDFYTTLNKLEDKFLESNNYSREEIQAGLNDLSSEYGINLK